MRQVKLTRQEAEFIIEACERDGAPLWLYLADDLRDLFGMPPRQQDEIERLQRALDAAAVDNEQYRQANDLLTRELAEARELLALVYASPDLNAKIDAFLAAKEDER